MEEEEEKEENVMEGMRKRKREEKGMDGMEEGEKKEQKGKGGGIVTNELFSELCVSELTSKAIREIFFLEKEEYPRPLHTANFINY